MAARLTPIDELDERILNLCTRINAATYELLVMIREFDERGGCLKWGLESTATWLAWRPVSASRVALYKAWVTESCSSRASRWRSATTAASWASSRNLALSITPPT